VEDNLSKTIPSRSGILTDTISCNSISSNNNSVNNDASNILFDQPKRAKLNEETFDTSNCIEELYLGAVKFCLKLHNNNNFCKSVVQNIQSDTENNILNPIIKLLMGVIQRRNYRRC